MYSARSYLLTYNERNFLLPVLRKKITSSSYFIATDDDDLENMLNRLNGLYDYYDEISNTVIYNCFKLKSIQPFREYIGVGF